ncbi:hypothetical protein ARMGADRAFT_419537 [Armillaria gallica]|uniref:Uncharacterized protein n=1 Tax=Armillaria gallica TaxID=47427 RepID=A0A2H3E1H3_ARMGA|nr:hypothetical protein ARMGADRAFT_419537 [Armillaria gallica]
MADVDNRQLFPTLQSLPPTTMSIQPSQHVASNPATGYSAAKRSPLVWSLPISCRQFLETPLDPEQWFELHAGRSDQDIQILRFGKAMGRSLKSVADEGWDKGNPQVHIDNMVGGRNQAKSAGLFETLVLVKATDIAAGFLRLPSRPFYPSFSKTLHLEGRHMGVLLKET